MSYFALWRTLFFVWFIILNAITLAAAAVNLTSSSRNAALRPVDVYLMFASSFSIVFVFPIILVDVLRRGALTSKVWFESVWLFVSWVMNLSGAAAITALSSSPSCLRTGGLMTCSSSQVLMGVTWTTTLIVLAQFAIILFSSIYYSKRFPEVWTTAVRDFEFWAGGGAAQLHSGPPSPTLPSFNAPPKQLQLHAALNTGSKNPVPHLERMAEQWQPATTIPGVNVAFKTMTLVPGAKPISTKAAVVVAEPQPLTLAYAPAVNPARQATHYNATSSAVLSVGVMPQRQPSKKTTATAMPSLYTSTVQQALGTSLTSAAPLSQPQEPLPIQNWPRVNPQDPFRKKHQTGSAPTPAVVASRHVNPTEVVGSSVPSHAHTSSASSTSSTASRRSGRGPRPRPPPLDLSKAMPNRIR